MKNRNLFVGVLVAISFLLSGCRMQDPFVGKWMGSYDMTNAVKKALIEEEGTEDFIEYLELEDLVLEVAFTFADGTLKMETDQDSVNTLVDHMETALYDIMDNMMRDMLLEMYQEMFPDVETLDDVAELTDGLYENGQAILDDMAVNHGYTDYDTYIKSSVESLDMSEILTEACERMNMSGEYDYDEEEGILTISYDDGTYEEMHYVFSGGELDIRMVTDDYYMVFNCEKVNE